MRVLITGIEGFVGSHLADYLLDLGEAGIEIHGTTFGPRPTLFASPRYAGITLHPVDITDASAVHQLVRTLQPERIVHLAGQAFVPASLTNPLETFRANIFGGIAMLEAARQLSAAGAARPAIIIVSSGEVYGRIRHEQLPIDESQPLAPHTPYSASKASLDLVAQQYALHFGVNVTIVRPFNHIGPRQNPSFVLSDFGRQFASIALGLQEPKLHVGNIGVQRDFTDVRDVVRAYWLLFEKHSDEFIFNVASNRGVEIRQFLDLLMDVSELRVEIVQEPERMRKYDVPVIRGSFARLQAATGWVPQIPIQQTVRDVYAFWLDALRGQSA